LKKKIILSLLFLILLVFSYPTVYYYYIKNIVYKATVDVYFDLLEYRRFSIKNNSSIGFYFNIDENYYTVFKDINNNNIFDSSDEILKKIYIKDINANVFLFNFFNKLNIFKNNSFFFYPDSTCSILDDKEDSSIFIIYSKDLNDNFFNRVFRIKFSVSTCEIKISRVLNVHNNILEFEN